MTKNQLQEMLMAEREWRIRELSLCKKLPFMYMQPLFRQHLSSYWRFCVPMIYAHWEGYVVAAIKLVIDYINDLHITYSSAPQYLIRLDNKERFGYLQGNCTFKQQDRFLKEFLNAQFQGIKIERSSISANSNLNFDQLKKMLSYLDLALSPTIIANKDTIEKLVWYRNSIAHGENCISVKQKDIEAFISAEIACFDEIICMLLSYVDNLHIQAGI